ncbi:hypothetical protein [Mycolicibacterium sp.]
MDSSDLFSHRQAPQVVSPAANTDEPVQHPVFSDSPRSTSAVDSPAR